MNRARRTGYATQQLEVKTARRTLHLAVTVSAIEGRRAALSNATPPKAAAGFVIVIEDTSDLLRAQKIAAWSEVARRVAHEIKNPLTPIALSAERILRQLEPAMQSSTACRDGTACCGSARKRSSMKRLRSSGWWMSSRSSPAFPPPSPLCAI